MTLVPQWLRAGVHAGGGEGLEKTKLNLGFIPLTDCAPLVIAHEKGFFQKHGLEVTLSREVSWANVRDKVFTGVLDGGHMLAAMPIATTLGLGELKKPTITALSLDLNGNAITVSQDLYRRMAELDPAAAAERPMSARALKQAIEAGRSAGRESLCFATVFPFSTHNYMLRYWLAAGGIDPDRDVRLVVIPPPHMVSYLSSGEIDGYCVGEPWNAQAVTTGVGRTLITDYEIWNNKPEKVLGVNRDWAERHPNTHRALLMALLETARWIDQSENRIEVVDILAREDYVNAPADVVKMSMTGSFHYQIDAAPTPLPDFNVFFRYAATFPWRSHAVWFITQMYRWGQLRAPIDMRKLAEEVYRPDLYREAAQALGLPCPTLDYKTEGQHDEPWTLREASEPLTLGADRFLDGLVFDPFRPMDYLERFELHNRQVTLDALARVNP
ncbi:CmpA/NrtA family ABC transporter substrate-binding protein [Methylocaldum sp.]|uniref:CmpA/NrtA family ABC transporter substrate-binding protein n=1 Tax=Methylocaldum sp. TaxID=1969727 RepID=UPI002D5B4B7E|nr:CmpA/NrtA family ABC transporter substrate-binding protein [Methylocaldum sp.]HYE36507.1 CmpA/NrtA family ABC transporter substrate-binding protein [Methylocaldum sp.]